MMWVLQETFSIIVVLMTILVLNRLRIKGTSEDLKEKVFSRYILYFVFYFLVILAVNQHTYSNTLRNVIGPYNYYLVAMTLNSIGIPLVFIRLAEPYVWSQVK